MIVFGGTGSSWLAVNRGNKINAVGTATQPIIFTSRDNVLGLNTDSLAGPVGRRRADGPRPGDRLQLRFGRCSNTCERDTEGAADARFRRPDDAYNAGKMNYVQIRYSGFVLGSNKELQSLTPEAIGSRHRARPYPVATTARTMASNSSAASPT